MHLKQINLDRILNKETANTGKKTTPMMEQYLEVKSRHKDHLLFYRMGDFYELFFDDAIIASKELGITLTKRGKYMDEDIPMCGVPYHAADSYLSRLIKSGFKIAIAEQLEIEENQNLKKTYNKIFPRDVVRIVTPGTILEEQLLESHNNNYLLCIHAHEGKYVLSWVDITTGNFKIKKLDTKNIKAEISENFFRIDPKEIILSKRTKENLLIFDQLDKWSKSLTLIPEIYFDEQNNLEKIEGAFKTKNIKSLGELSNTEVSCLGALLEYIKSTQKENMPKFINLSIENNDDIMLLDKISTQSLEIFNRLNGDKKGSLIDIIDNTVSPGGARLLRNHFKQPLINIDQINERLDYVENFCLYQNLINEVRDNFKGLADIERSLTRISAGLVNPRDTFGIHIFIEKSLLGIKSIRNTKDKTLFKLISKDSIISNIKNLSNQILKTLVNNPPTLISNGGFIKSKFSEELDRLRNIKEDFTKKNIALQKEYIDKTGINTLKIKYNNFHGFFIEVTNKNSDKILNNFQSEFDLIQTTKNVSRFQTTDLKNNSQEILNADSLSLELEKKILKKLNFEILKLHDQINNFFNSISLIDVITSNAKFANDNNLIRPILNDSLDINIVEGRHPVVEESLMRKGESFVANDFTINEKTKTWLMTGPNMAGKSTFLRQNAIIILMAQVGCFVPAQKAEIGVIDKIFTRIGASDDLASGQSTFMTEMVETARILNGATQRSLVILDEVGRGTSTSDGFAIAFAILEFLVKEIKCPTLFATHYHDLAYHAKNFNQILPKTLKTKKWNGNVIFLYKVIDGVSQSSFGLHVAKIAGINNTVIDRATKYIGIKKNSSKLEELPEENDSSNIHQDLENLKTMENALKKINLDNITPRQAMDFLYDLKKISD